MYWQSPKMCLTNFVCCKHKQHLLIMLQLLLIKLSMVNILLCSINQVNIISLKGLWFSKFSCDLTECVGLTPWHSRMILLSIAYSLSIAILVCHDFLASTDSTLPIVMRAFVFLLQTDLICLAHSDSILALGIISYLSSLTSKTHKFILYYFLLKPIWSL